MAIKLKKSTNGTSHKAPASKAKLIVKGQAKRPTAANLEQRIRDRAYFLYLDRGCSHGVCANQDWYEAEKQIKRELGLN